MKKHLQYLSLYLLFAIPSSVTAKVTLPAIFNDHMVLQQNSEVVIWGWAKPLEEVTVIGSWDRNASGN